MKGKLSRRQRAYLQREGRPAHKPQAAPQPMRPRQAVWDDDDDGPTLGEITPASVIYAVAVQWAEQAFGGLPDSDREAIARKWTLDYLAENNRLHEAMWIGAETPTHI